jgi:hypothetical protein
MSAGRESVGDMSKATDKGAPAPRWRTGAQVFYLGSTVLFAVAFAVLAVIGIAGYFGFALASIVPFVAAFVTFDRFRAVRTGRAPRLLPPFSS